MSRPSAVFRCVGLALVLCACSGEQPNAAEVLHTSRVQLSLLEHPELRSVREEHPEFPVRVDILRPRRQTNRTGELGAQPAIEVTPDCEVAFELPKTPKDAYLRFGLSVLSRNYQGQGLVHFEFELDGKPAFEHAIPSSQAIDREKRRWHPFQLELEGARKLVIRTRYTGTYPGATRCAISDLTIETPLEIERTTPSAERPNVVLVVIDTLRADRLSCYGNPLQISPTLDALAKRGTVFEHAYTPSPWTVPSTAAILTSLSPIGRSLEAVQSNYQPHAIDMLAEAFQIAGLATGGFSCNPLISASRNFDQGFESFHGNRWWRSSRILDDVLSWIDENQHRRFFLYLHTVDPHDPYEPLDDFHLPGPPRPAGLTEDTSKLLMDRFRREAGFTPEFLDSVARYNLPLYDAEVAGADHMLGEVFARLRELGLEDTTVVAVTSDHGEEFGEHGMLGHANQLFAESHHVPLVIAGPGVPAGERVAERVENRFIGPTLLALAGAPPLGMLQGPNLLDGKQREVHTHGAFYRSNRDGWIRDTADGTWKEAKRLHGRLDDRWLFLRGATGPDGGYEVVNLFDLDADPNTEHDVSANHPDVVARLCTELDGFIAERRLHGPGNTMESSDDRAVMEALGYVGEGE